MGKDRHDSSILYFTLATASLIVVASGTGLFSGGFYSREMPSWAAQAIGQDMLNLIVLVPTLLISAVYTMKGSRPSLFVWLGAMMYTIYTYIIYCFAVHFNQLFVVYCAVLGLSVYSTVVITLAMDSAEIKSWFKYGTSARVAAGLLSVLAVVFSSLWLSEIVPATLGNEVPGSLQEAGLITNPVHVLDLSTVLPGFFIASMLLWKKHALGYVLVPIFLAFATLMDITIWLLILVMKDRGVVADGPPAIVFALLGIITISIFVGFVRPATHSTRGGVVESGLFTNVKGS